MCASASNRNSHQVSNKLAPYAVFLCLFEMTISNCAIPRARLAQVAHKASATLDIPKANTIHQSENMQWANTPECLPSFSFEHACMVGSWMNGPFTHIVTLRIFTCDLYAATIRVHLQVIYPLMETVVGLGSK